MRLQQFEILLAIAEAGSIRGAAKMLKRTQPSLTKAIRLMEEELSAPILRRTARGVQLTEYGHAALKRAKAITLEVGRLRDEIAQLRGAGGGQIRIGVSPLAAISILPQAVVPFREQFPDVALTVLDTLYPDSLPLVRDGHLDFAVGPLQPGIKRSDFDITALLTTGVNVITSRSHAKAGSTTLSALLDETWIVYGPPEGPGALYVEAFKRNRLKPPVATTASHSLFATFSLVEQTKAFCIMPDRLAADFQREFNLTVVPVEEKLPMLDIVMIARAGVPPTPAARALSDQIRKRARQLVRS